MPKEKRFSRELREDELPPEANEGLEEASPVHRKGPLRHGRAGGTEERAGFDKRPYTPPKQQVHLPLIKFPPLGRRKVTSR